MEPDFKKIAENWQKKWREAGIYQTHIDPAKPKYYVLDMFPYPSGAGLHVGHPLGYIASDIVARFKRLKGFNVLHPMGFDAFGLPAEQYAIQTGKHPAETTETNIKRYKEQLNNIGFSYDWNREVVTSDPSYYRWTQWIFLKLFNAWYNNDTQKAEEISTLIQHFEYSGSERINAAGAEHTPFSAQDWNRWPEKTKRNILMQYRLAYQSYATVNWCEALGTVLANDEVKDGLSERGGHPVEKRSMRQWFLRITAYAERLLNDLEQLEWTDAMKDMQRNWIGRSEGAMLRFKVEQTQYEIEVFTTRPDTIFGVDFITLAPEHELLDKITPTSHLDAVQAYTSVAKNRSERERMTEVKKVSGVFTGAFATHPFTNKKIPIWVGDYVLAGYGTGAVMAVPAGDQRDWDFATHFQIPITPIHQEHDSSKAANPAKDSILVNSNFLNGLQGEQAFSAAVDAIEKTGIGKRKVNYRLRDAGFSRQRYWGEPFPVVYREDIAYALDENELPLELPLMEDFKPTGQPEGPLAKATQWVHTNEGVRETDTMPGYAGSSWYFLRYMDANNPDAFVSKEAEAYWQDVDLYIGGTEHAVGHLMYARFWQKFLFDRHFVSKSEPFKKLINQGMILGRSNFVYRAVNDNLFVSHDILNKHPDIKTIPLHVDVNIVRNDVLDIEAFKIANNDNKNARFLLNENAEYVCGTEVEKMSKSKFNVVNPDDIIEEYGADTLRLYEMFLGPIDQPKPWNTNGIEGVYRFLNNKLWRLFYNEKGDVKISDEPPTEKELRILHKTIRKIEEDIERFSFNTSVSTFMICVNDLLELKCSKKKILKDLLIILSPYAPHVAEELWLLVKGNNDKQFIVQETFPEWKMEYIEESTVMYPVAFNGKVRFKIEVPADLPEADIQQQVTAHSETSKWLNGPPKKIIVVKGRMVNVVI